MSNLKENFADYARKWLKNKALDSKTTTKARYDCIIEKHLIPVFGKYDVGEISDELIRDFLKREREKFKYNTVLAVATVFKSIIMGEFETLRSNRPRGVFHIPREKTSINTLKNNEAKKLNNYLSSSDDKMDIGIYIALNMGLRIGEVCAIKWKDIDLKKGSISISSTLQRVQSDSDDSRTKVMLLPPKTPDSKREVPILGDLEVFLQKNKADKNCFLLSGSQQMIEPRRMQAHFRRICDKVIRRHVKFHDLRHTFATIAISEGADVKTVSEILGHKDITTTLGIYRSVSFDDKKNALKKLNKSIGYKKK